MSAICSTGFRSKILGERSFESLFAGGCIELYSGARPTNADMAPTGTLLARITRGGLPWTPGEPANGLTFRRSGSGVTMPDNAVWGLKGLANGDVGWCRLRAMVDPGGYTTAAPRIDGVVGLLDTFGDYQLRLSTLTIATGLSAPITSWWFLFPPLT